MKIVVANLTLRFYVREGWTKKKVQFYLANKKYKVEFCEIKNFPEFDYYAVYDNSGRKIFKKEILKNEFDNPFKIDYEDWYVE